MNQRIAETSAQAASLLEQFSQNQSAELLALAQKLSATFAAGGQLLLAGSARQQPLVQFLASHFSFKLSFDRPVLPALALGGDATLAAAMSAPEDAEQMLVRHYRAFSSAQHLLLLFNDGGDSKGLKMLRDEALENGQTVALISTRGEVDPLCRDGVEICIDLATDSPPRGFELTLFVGHLLCELVEAELFGV